MHLQRDDDEEEEERTFTRMHEGRESNRLSRDEGTQEPAY